MYQVDIHTTQNLNTIAENFPDSRSRVMGIPGCFNSGHKLVQRAVGAFTDTYYLTQKTRSWEVL